VSEIELTPEGSKYRLPSQPTVIQVTPDMASDWLSYRNHPKNRPLSKSVAGRYQTDMEQDRWALTPEGLIFDTNGYIISGQHRLKAVANSGLTIAFWIFPDQPRNIFDVVDQGYKRTAAHVLRVPHATAMANGARILAALADGDRWGMPRYPKITTPEIVETFRAWPELSWYINEVTSIYKYASVPIGPHVAVLAQAARSPHIGRIQDWLEGLHTGANLAPGDARLSLRNRFQAGIQVVGGTNRRDLAYALIVKAWNAYAQDIPLPILRWMRTEALPRVVHLDIQGGAV
jgi:hypothetical protein